MLSAVKLWKSSSISGPSATLKPISPKIAMISSMVWRDRVDAAFIFGAAGQGEVERLARELGVEGRAGEGRLLAHRWRWRLRRVSDVDLGAECLALLRGHRPQRLHQAGDFALLAQRVDAHLFQRIDGRAGAGDGIQPFLLQSP